MNKEQIYNFLSTQSNIFEILRENGFQLAKDFFGEGSIMTEHSEGEHIECQHHQVEWQYKLQHMVISEDPLAYMKNFIK